MRQPSFGWPFWVAVAATALLPVSALAPLRLARDLSSTVHAATEMLSVLIAAMIFAIGWSGSRDDQPRPLVVLSAGFLIVASLNILELHPGAAAHSAIADVIALSQCESYAAALTLLLAGFVEWRTATPLFRWATLGLAVVLAGLCVAAGLDLPSTLPPVPLVALNLAATSLLWLKSRSAHGARMEWLATAAWINGIGAVYLVAGGQPELDVLLGHVLAVASYAVILGIVVRLAVHDPLVRMREARNALAESESRYAGIVGAALDGVLLFDGMNQIVYANATAEEIFGYERGTLTGVFLRDLIPVAMRGMHERAVAEFTQSGMSKRRMAPGREVVGLRADGTEFPIEAIISRADTGRRTYFTALVRDVSEERRQQAASKQQTSELVVAKEQAERASREKSDFLSRMSHEFRTPLNSILGYAQLLEIGSAEERREAAREILNAANYLLALVNELLDLGRVEAGKLEMNIGSVEVAATLRQAASMVAPLLEERGITLEQAIDAGIPPMLADATRLRQVLINLLSNAAKYNRQGGRIIVSCERRDPSLRINVQDEGPGIPPEKRARLFQPFERLGVDGSGVEGTGLGLALCQRLVDLMGGRVGVQSAPVQGSIFWLELPIAFAGAGKQDASQP